MKADQTEWFAAQQAARHWLSSHGIKVAIASYYSPFDLYTPNGTRLEVKHSLFSRRHNGQHSWQFNIHRHNKVDGSHVDFYILRADVSPVLQALGFDTPVYLVIPSPIEVPTVSISLRTMLSKWGWSANAYEQIREFDSALDASRREETYALAATQNPATGTAQPKPAKPPRPRPFTDRAITLYAEGYTPLQMWEKFNSEGAFENYSSSMASRGEIYRFFRKMKDGKIKMNGKAK